LSLVAIPLIPLAKKKLKLTKVDFRIKAVVWPKGAQAKGKVEFMDTTMYLSEPNIQYIQSNIEKWESNHRAIKEPEHG
jgi:hypothetical protein